jgi:hypothetical protein
MTKVIKLAPDPEPEMHQPTIDLLRELLARAEKGEIHGLAYAAVLRGRAGTGWGTGFTFQGGMSCANALTTAIAVLHRRFVDMHMEEAEDTPPMPAEPA